MYRYILFFSRLSNLTDNTVSFLFFFSSFIISLPVPPFLSFLLFLLFFFHFSHYFSACSPIPFLPFFSSFLFSLFLCLFLHPFPSFYSFFYSFISPITSLPVPPFLFFCPPPHPSYSPGLGQRGVDFRSWPRRRTGHSSPKAPSSSLSAGKVRGFCTDYVLVGPGLLICYSNGYSKKKYYP